MRESSPLTKQTCLARTCGNPSKLAKICQLVGTACACLPWGLLTYGCIDFPGFGINGYPEIESKCKIESTGICGRYTHTCDNLFEADKIQSKQIGKLLFSKNNSSKPAKTCLQSIRNILYSSSAHEQGFQQRNLKTIPPATVVVLTVADASTAQVLPESKSNLEINSSQSAAMQLAFREAMIINMVMQLPASSNLLLITTD